MVEVHTSGIVPYSKKGLIGIQIRGKKNQKNGEKYAFFGGHCDKDETPEQTMLREAFEELKITPTEYYFIGRVEKDQGEKIVYQDTYMIPVNNFNDLTDYEGLGIEAFTLEQARELKINPGDNLVLAQIKEYFLKKGIL